MAESLHQGMAQWVQCKLGKQYLEKKFTLPWESNPGPTPNRGDLATLVASVGLKKFCIFSLGCMTFRLLVAWYQSGYPGQCGATWLPTKFKLDSIPECYFICDLFDNIAPLKYLGETCYVEFTRRCPTEVARGAKRWETRQICFLPSLWYVWQNTSFTNMNFFG